MSYQALYRSCRPQTFADLVGQSHIRQTLTNAISLSQLAHAYLFCGPRGTGKTSTAKVLAKAVNCLHPNGVEPCNACETCQEITAGNHVDVEEIDAASNRGVEEIRQLRDKVHYAPTSLRKKVYIVDEVHMLTTEAFNALLKTLEEPPAYVIFILATTEPHKIPSTIVSRCQRFDFRRIPIEVIVKRLEEVATQSGWTWDGQALWQLAEAADGGLRDALGLLEQAAAFGQGCIKEDDVATIVGGVGTGDLLKFVQAIVSSDPLSVIEKLGAWYQAGKEASRIVYDILHIVRDLFVVKLSPDSLSVLGRPLGEPYRILAGECSTEWLLYAMQKLGEMYTQLRYVDQPRIALETLVVSLAFYTPQTTVARLSPGTKSAPSPDNKIVNTVSENVQVQEESEPTKTKRAPKTSAARKRKVLTDLQVRQDPEILATILANWPRILQSVKVRRIQTHAWLTNGQPVLATQDAIVVCFQSRIHRDAIMKPDERQAVEAALLEVMNRPLAILALLQADWDEFLRNGAPLVENPLPQSSTGELPQRAIELFGKDLVEIIPEE